MADFNLGRIRFVWQGEWQPSTAYVRDDVVQETDSSYVCVEAHTSGSTFAENADKFEIMARGASATPTTQVGDIIYRGASGDERLPIGSPGEALFVDSSGVPEWATIEDAEATYYVTTGGSNDDDGQTTNNAFATINHAVSQVTGPANIFVKTGTFYEQLPIDVPQGVAVVGEGQRTTEIKPVNISNAGATVQATSGADTSTTIQIQDSQDVGEEWQVGAVVTGTSISGTVTITDITADAPVAGFTTLTVSFSSQSVSEETVTLVSDYSEETMFRMGDSSMLHKVLMNGLTGFEPDLQNPTDMTAATVKGVYVALDPASPITNKSPYVLECSSFSTGGVGAVVDGTVHNSGNRSIVFHAYTNIHSDGVGYWVNGEGKTEIVSCFTYYCWFGYTTTNGGKIRSLSGNNSYGTYGVVSGGFNANETPITGTLKGEQLEILSVSGTFGTGNTITGGTSGATGEVLNVQSDKIYYIPQSGTFTEGETVTDGTSGATAEIATGGVTGQKGFLLIVDGLTAEPAPGSSVSIAGDSLAYIVQNVSGTYSNTSSVLNILLANEKIDPSADGTSVTIREEYSQARLTGHDFLSIGTGSKPDTNYPGSFTQNPSQSNEVVEDLPGRVFYVSTDQDGNFRVGDYFRVDQATGRATLNASAFDLSGLTSLRLGAIGAQLGELVEEFSSDATLSGNSNSAVPTEAATRAYFTQVATDIVPATDNSQTLGTPTNRWQEVYVGPGSVQIGTVKLSEVGGNFSVSTEAGLPSTLEADTFDTGSITLSQNNITGTNSNEDLEVAASGTGVVRFNSAIEIVGDRLYGPSTFIIDPATHDDNTGTLIVAGNLQVDGTTTTINSTTLEVDDKNVVLAKGAADATAADGAGITVDGASAALTYRESGDNWELNKDLDIIGNISVSGTIDGRDVASDGSKLDGIESNADVTDATNVQSSGALMDSELTNESAVKNIDQELTTASAVDFTAIQLKDSSYTRLEWFNDSDAIDSDDYWIAEHNNDGSLRLMRRDVSAGSWGNNLILEADGSIETGGPIKDSSGNNMLSGVVATGQVSLSGNVATVATGISATDATFMLAIGIDDPNADSEVAGALFWDDSQGEYYVRIRETETDVNPTVNYDVIRVR